MDTFMKTTAMQENSNACKIKDKNVWTKNFSLYFSTHFSVK